MPTGYNSSGHNLSYSMKPGLGTGNIASKTSTLGFGGTISHDERLVK